MTALKLAAVDERKITMYIPICQGENPRDDLLTSVPEIKVGRISRWVVLVEY